MNYLALALGTFCGLIGLYCLSLLIGVIFNRHSFESPTFAAVSQSAFVAWFGSLAVWLFGMVV